MCQRDALCALACHSGQEDEHAIIAAWPSKHADVVSNERLLLGVIHLRQASEKKPTCASGYSGALDHKDQNGFHQLLRATEGLIDWKNTFVHASIHVMGEFLMSLAEMLLRVGPTGLTMFAEKLERPTRDDIESGRAKISFKKSILNVEWHFATKKDMRAWSVECVEMLKFVSGDKSKEGGLGALAQAMQTLAGICGGVEDFCKTSKVRKRMVDAMASMKTNVSTFFAGASDDTRALLVEWMEASVERLAKVEGRVVQLEQRMDNKDKEVEKVTDEVEVLKKALASLASTVDKNRDASGEPTPSHKNPSPPPTKKPSPQEPTRAPSPWTPHAHPAPSMPRVVLLPSPFLTARSRGPQRRSGAAQDEPAASGAAAQPAPGQPPERG